MSYSLSLPDLFSYLIWTGGFSWPHIFTALFGAGSSTLPCSAKVSSCDLLLQGIMFGTNWISIFPGPWASTPGLWQADSTHYGCRSGETYVWGCSLLVNVNGAVNGSFQFLWCVQVCVSLLHACVIILKTFLQAKIATSRLRREATVSVNCILSQ